MNINNLNVFGKITIPNSSNAIKETVYSTSTASFKTLGGALITGNNVIGGTCYVDTIDAG